jgi:flavin reductase (DIM6/NTAB) family NADH-FMN oxidoreductase RutF
VAAPMTRVRRASAIGAELGGAFREAMSHLAASVVMVTTRLDDRPWGLTISACCSVSATPPTILVSLGDRTVSATAIGEQGQFGVSILGEDQIDAARVGSAPGESKFVDRFCRPEEFEDSICRIPVVRGAVAHLDCSVVRTLEIADHTVFFGAVRDVVLSPGAPPLLYWGRDYASIDRGEPWYS